MKVWLALLVVGMVGAENVKIEDLDLAITAATGGEEFTVSAGTFTGTYGILIVEGHDDCWGGQRFVYPRWGQRS